MDHREKLLSIVKEKGPLLPAQINRELRTNVLFASAMLAEMVDQKKIRLTSMKIGGSPLYYCEGQEPALEQFTEKIGPTERAAFNLLKGSKIVRDRDQEPPARVALRELKDFAVPLEVTANGSKDLFWKFYAVSDQEANSLIKNYLNARQRPRQAPPSQPKPQPEPQRQQEQPPRQEVPKPQEVQSTIGSVQEKGAEAKQERVGPTQTLEPAPKPVTSVKMTQLEESKIPEFEYQPSFSFSTLVDTDEKVKIEKQPEPETKTLEFPEDDEFFNHIKSFFDNAGIEITELETVRRGSEYDLIVKLPSNVGMLNYYCKAKSKAKLNEGDLSTAYVQGMIKKLPILLVTGGDLTKRAEELLAKEFKNMFVKKLE
ncbi:hypothetical protein ACFL3V_01650 [Nanoarchaeota archaeon]